MVTTPEQSMLEHADEFLHAGYLVQASEKVWGAVAHYLKAVAKQRGWQNGSHRDFFTIKDRLADETVNPAHIKLLFLALRGLHQNFYEPLATYGEVQAGIAAANEFVETLNNAGVFAIDSGENGRQPIDHD